MNDVIGPHFPTSHHKALNLAVWPLLLGTYACKCSHRMTHHALCVTQHLLGVVFGGTVKNLATFPSVSSLGSRS
jgi:hypothetical protein